MKKIILALLLLIPLAACSNEAVAKVSDGNALIFHDGENTYTKQDSFEAMKNNDYTAIIANDIITKIAALENIDQDEINSEATERVQEMADTYGDYYDQLVEYYGGEENIHTNVAATVASEKLVSQYIELHFDELVEEHLPVKMQLAYFDDAEEANAVIADIENGSTFEMAVLEHGYNISAAPQIYLDSDSLALEVKTYLNSDESTGLSDVIMTSTTSTDADGNSIITPRYYVINVIDRDAANFRDEFIQTMINNTDTTEALNYFFEKYDITFYDQRTYDLLSATYNGLK